MMLLSHTDIENLMLFEKLTETYLAYILPKKEKIISNLMIQRINLVILILCIVSSYNISQTDS